MIQDNARLTALLARIRAADWIALDTEADSLHAYPEKLCLLQISLPGEDAIIDPLARLNLAPLLEVLKDRELILHGADYDLRLLWKSLRFRPRGIFDTMWAARLLGNSECGLIHLVAQVLGVVLEKGPQKMNWARRPLTKRMETYARNDTRYLRPLSEALSDRLRTLGRLDWQREVCAQMISECCQDRAPDPDVVWRLKGSDRLDGKALAVLRELWHWREREATRRNRPPYFIVSHEKLVALASAAARRETADDVLPAGFPALRHEGLAEALERGLRKPTAEHPRPRRSTGRRLTRSEQLRFDELKRHRDQCAADLKIDPSLIASRAMLVALAVNWKTHQNGLMAWQRKLLAIPD
ncbi:MAG: HRDC domain-containing protein [Verrucomicrobia bacterium]|nr:HRDC domain-containing protein [Verrucomicrobiota bacterium]